MHWPDFSLYRVGRWILGAALGFYFSRIESLILRLPGRERAEIESARWQVPAEALAFQGKGTP